MNYEEFCDVLRKIPKAELHLHIEAVITTDSVRKLYQNAFGKPMSGEELASLFSYDDLNGFIAAFIKVQQMFRSPDDFNLVFDDFEKYLVSENIRHCEAFFAPTAFLKIGFRYEDMINVFSKKIAEIRERRGIIIRLLLDVSRTFGLENAERNYRLLKEYPCPDVIGIGLGGAELKGPAEEFAPVFEQARRDGFHVVTHSGEDTGPEEMWSAIRCLRPERIGHGIAAVKDPALIEELARTKLPLEISVTSNVFTKKIVQKVSDHPIRQFYDKGVFVTVNTDDPVFFKTTLIDEFWKLHSECRFTMPEIKQLILNGFNALFISDDEKASYAADVEAAWTKYVG